jgi:hypothetical protein
MGGGIASPLEITGLVAWLDFSDAATLFTDTTRTTPVASDADAIAGVTDKSGAGNHLIQTTSTARPGYKVNILNGRSAALGDGADYMVQVNNPVAYAQPNYIFIAAKHGDAAAGKHLFDGAGAGRNLIGTAAGPVWTMYAGTVVSSVSATDTNNNIFCGVFNGASSALYVNGGTAVISGNAGAQALGVSAAGGDFIVGAGVGGANIMPAGSYLYEILVYDTTLSTFQINQIGGYLKTKWNLTWTTVSA